MPLLTATSHHRSSHVSRAVRPSRRRTRSPAERGAAQPGPAAQEAGEEGGAGLGGRVWRRQDDYLKAHPGY